MKKRVLIIEDNERNLELESDLLMEAGFEVLQARDAAGGLEAVRRQKPDIIILDIRLPDIRGFELIKLLHQDKDACSIPVVFVTASVVGQEAEEVSKIIPQGYGFIPKPINTRTFAQEISGFLK